MKDVIAKVHFKDTWFCLSTGDVLEVEYSTQTVYGTTVLEAEQAANKIRQQRIGSTNWDGKKHVCEEILESEPKKSELSDAEMFQFILNNTVSITPDGSVWSKTDGTKVRKQYTVSINGAGMSGYDLKEAIQYYHDNLRK